VNHWSAKNFHTNLCQASLVAAEGYPVEEYFVDTPDGYILKVFRIPGSPESPPAEGKIPVFLQHGLLCSSADWVKLSNHPNLNSNVGLKPTIE
jgi:Partial alpha/beta-hydrolase lipase region